MEEIRVQICQQRSGKVVIVGFKKVMVTGERDKWRCLSKACFCAGTERNRDDICKKMK